MSRDGNLAIVGRLINDFLNKHDFSAADEIFAEDLIDHQAAVDAVGRENVKRFVGGLWESFPDLQCELSHVLSDGNKVCVYVIGRGTHKGEFLGIAPTGRPVTLLGVSVMRIADGRIAERWNITDMAGLRAQLEGAT
jgi:steroid delta-isomerase-like uncharacterized protein